MAIKRFKPAQEGHESFFVLNYLIFLAHEANLLHSHTNSCILMIGQQYMHMRGTGSVMSAKYIPYLGYLWHSFF